MELYKGLLFHNRYILIAPLGCGASAEVWKARDTKANNLIVALKIFSQHSEMDSYGLQNFEREFTTVYNMKHSNLLPPTGYDISEGRPYLIMQYCENGSCSSMIGRVEEEDLIKFLHDVSAGLEYLHDHNIIHQDIKPDNILLDDNCNFMVTDFGISVNADNGIFQSNSMSGGTRAYMGPERFEGITNNASDMWSLGATAVELLTGNPPYGEHGGLLQAEGEPLPELPNLQPEVKDMVLSCLNQDPNLRIRANSIRQKIELYWETGSWIKHSPLKSRIKIITGILSILLCGCIYVWDYNRTKIYYYKDYSEYWGVPKGIGRLSRNEFSHRESSYRFEYSRHKLRRTALVNSAGKVVGHTDTEHMNSRYSDVYYYYTDHGKIDYKTIFNTSGRMLFKMDFDENLRTVTFRQNDEYGTEMNLDANTNMLYKNNTSTIGEKSHISRYLLSYDEKGLLIERKYVGLQNIPACDKDRIYGQRYEYDSKGRKIEEAYIGADGNLASNNNGLAIRVYSYDDDDNWTSVSYLNAGRQGSHDGNNCSLVHLAYDKYGNRIKELYYMLDGTAAIRTDMNVSGFSYEYNKKGFRISQTCLGLDGSPAYCNAGFVSLRDSCNEDGFTVNRSFLDEFGQPTLYNKDGESYSSITIHPNKQGLPLETTLFDENGYPMEEANGVCRTVRSYDDRGNQTKEEYFDKDNQPTLAEGFYHAIKLQYDEFDRLIHQSYWDEKGQPATDDGTTFAYKFEYNRQGAITKVSYIDSKGELVIGTNLCAGHTYEYDELGNQRSLSYFNTKGDPCMTSFGYSKVDYVYNPQTNFLEEVKEYDANGKLLSDAYYKHDSKGNIIESYTLVNGKLQSETAVEKSKYDANNRETSQWYCDLNGNRVNRPKYTYSQANYEYDEKGNLVMITFWGIKDEAAVDDDGAHKRTWEYDSMNRMVRQCDFGKEGKPLSGTDANPEAIIKYDQWGNIAELSCFDGYGKPRLTADGYFTRKNQYDRRGNVIHEEYLGTDGKLIYSKSIGYAKADRVFDNHGNLLESKFYDETSACIRIEILRYNEKNRLIEQRVCDGKGELSDKFYGISRVVLEYDDKGVVPRIRKYYNQSGTLMATESWNEAQSEWNTMEQTAQGSAAIAAANWQEVVRNDAEKCPIKLDEGLYAQAIRYSQSSVTLTLKLSEISKYEMGDVNEDSIKENGGTIKEQFRKAWSLPNNVSLKIIFVDKANRTICTI